MARENIEKARNPCGDFGLTLFGYFCRYIFWVVLLFIIPIFKQYFYISKHLNKTLRNKYNAVNFNRKYNDNGKEYAA